MAFFLTLSAFLYAIRRAEAAPAGETSVLSIGHITHTHHGTGMSSRWPVMDRWKPD